MTAIKDELRRPSHDAGASRAAGEEPKAAAPGLPRAYTTFVGGIRCVLHTEQPDYHVKEVSRLADGLIRQVRESNPRLTVERQAILALLNACDLLLEQEKQLEAPRPAPIRRPVRRARVTDDEGAHQMSIYDYELPSWRPIEEADAAR
ncbi:MAG: cell division protein ZapA [Bacillota bacterium]|nr:cell division protein ZapA [Bacillota bacterium]